MSACTLLLKLWLILSQQSLEELQSGLELLLRLPRLAHKLLMRLTHRPEEPTPLPMLPSLPISPLMLGAAFTGSTLVLLAPPTSET